MMRRQRVRLLLTFLSGVVAAAVVSVVAGTVGSVAATRYEDLGLFTNVLHIIRKNYVEEVDERKLVEGAVRGMLADLDPHSSYLDPTAHKEMRLTPRASSTASASRSPSGATASSRWCPRSRARRRRARACAPATRS
jgi:C-terminal processing protease CtpA/Prc